MQRASLFFLLAGGLSGCGGGGALPTGPSPVSSSVQIEYRLSGGEAESRSLSCTGQMRVRPSWWGFSQVTMIETGRDTWAVLFEEVPIGPQRVHVAAPEPCTQGSLTLNGVPFPATNEAVSFTLHPDGSVTP